MDLVNFVLGFGVGYHAARAALVLINRPLEPAAVALGALHCALAGLFGLAVMSA